MTQVHCDVLVLDNILYTSAVPNHPPATVLDNMDVAGGWLRTAEVYKIVHLLYA